MAGLHYDSLADLPVGMRKQVAAHLLAKSDLPAEDTVKASKYHNIKMEIEGLRFDSKKEARRYEQLLDAVHVGFIEDLRLQHEFTLQEAYTTAEGERIRAIRYKADFTYRIKRAGYDAPLCILPDDLEYWRSVVQRHGHNALVVEDVKSKATRTKKYIMKYKMMADHGYIIREV